MSSPPLSPAGASGYNSDTMSVGDGTWDSSRNTFLLPNLVGLNFDTMRFNGMGNRFRELPGYHNLILAHGILAAITFLLLVPASILLPRIYSRRYSGRRSHIWLNVLALILVIVIFTLGNVAVGPSRRLSNPHHGTGTAIFVLVLVGFFQGWWAHRKDWRRKQSYEPLQVTLHSWLGWITALLGLAQIPLGLTLYGSPKSLFILYTLAAFTLLVIYFAVVRHEKRHYSRDNDSRYDDRSTVTDQRKQREPRSWIKPALAGAGVFALANRFRGRRRDDRAPHAPEVVGSRRHSGSFTYDDKYSYYSDKGGRWESRLFKIAAPIGLGWLITRAFDRHYGHHDSEVSSYAPAPTAHGAYAVPLGQPGYDPRNQPGYDPRNQPGYDPRNQPGYDPHHAPPVGAPMPPGQPIQPGPMPMAPGVGPTGMPVYPPPQNYNDREPLPSEHHPLNQAHSRASSYSYSISSAVQERRESHGLRDGIATLGALGLAKSYMNRWRGRKEDRRLEDERNARLHGQKFTGDGRPIKRHHARSGSSDSLSSVTSPQHNVGPVHPNTTQGIPPLPAGTFPVGSAGAAAVEAERDRERRAQEALPLGGVLRQPATAPAAMPAIPADPQGIFHPESSSTDSYSSPGNHSRRNSQTIRNTSSGPAPPPPVFGSPNRRGNQHQRNESMSPGEDSGVTSPPVSVRVKMHKDGRHITLSRPPQQEAALRRQQAAAQNNITNESVSTLGSEVGPSNRFRRRDTQDRQNAEAMRVERQNLAAARNQAAGQGSPSSKIPMPVSTPQNLPLPPPIPESSGGNRPSPLGESVGSPSAYTSDGQGTDYANNRRRRRAERARARQAKEEREARTGKTVGFE